MDGPFEDKPQGRTSWLSSRSGVGLPGPVWVGLGAAWSSGRVEQDGVQGPSNPNSSVIHAVTGFCLPLLKLGRSSDTSRTAANCSTLDLANPPGPSQGMVMWEQPDTRSTLKEHILSSTTVRYTQIRGKSYFRSK